ncbi:uncharacterized protein KQ657_000536 [Scheffersomyces spartinae]|uniref:Uncharacterized protein n=1 Tax=Scheffersomyces spartinae TaxID=45513 RepID=A0A9P8AIB2_9ASCO|nr:uncharacterized protein KQ657_000536 [Scheffersomyces spartinae]KAG7193469.1 hypothetical protein KQ657_000536 [Scheffersomyces spartinae]
MRLVNVLVGFIAALAAGAAVDPLDERFAKIDKVQFESQAQMLTLQKEHPRLCVINMNGIKWIVFDFLDVLPEELHQEAKEAIIAAAQP